MLTTNQNLQQGRYRIVGQIEQNRTGASYEAFDNVLGANVLVREISGGAGKIITPSQMEARTLNFAEKAKTLTQMNHKSLLLVKDFFSEIDQHYLVTEFAEGGSPGELLEKNKTAFSLVDAADWAYDLLDALNYLHTLAPPVVHGEVKPQNIRLSANGKAKLVVFNLVKNADEMRTATANQTFDAAVLPFMPLEQIWQGLDAASKKVILTNFDDKSEKILEQPADARTDLFSLAATVYYLLTAHAPADALTRSIEILEGKADPLESPTQLNPSVPQEVSDVLMKALEIKRENRFSSAVIMQRVLRTAFVRAEERETIVASAPAKTEVEEEAFLEIPFIEPKPVLAAPPAPKNREMETEQARQLELIKQQLRQAEQRRLEAEKRAAEAEQRLVEAEKHNVAEPEQAETFASVEHAPSAAATVSNEPKKEASAYQSSSDEFPSLFAEPPKEGGAFKKIAAVAVALIVLGGAGFGIWTFTQSKPGGQTPPLTTGSAVIIAPTTDNTPAAETAATPVVNEQANAETEQPVDSPAVETANPDQNPGAVKPRPVAPQTAQVKKPAATPVKKADTPKKVTLDDLLKDN